MQNTSKFNYQHFLTFTLEEVAEDEDSILGLGCFSDFFHLTATNYHSIANTRLFEIVPFNLHI